MRRREEKYLAGDALDLAVQSLNETACEVNEATSVGVCHLTEVDDDRNTLAEVLCDATSVCVNLGLNGHNFVEVRGCSVAAGVTTKRGDLRASGVGF